MVEHYFPPPLSGTNCPSPSPSPPSPPSPLPVSVGPGHRRYLYFSPSPSPSPPFTPSSSRGSSPEIVPQLLRWAPPTDQRPAQPPPLSLDQSCWERVVPSPPPRDRPSLLDCLKWLLLRCCCFCCPNFLSTREREDERIWYPAYSAVELNSRVVMNCRHVPLGRKQG